LEVSLSLRLATLIRLILIIASIGYFILIYKLANRVEELPPVPTIATVEQATEATHYIENITIPSEPALLNSPLLYPDIVYKQPITNKEAEEAIVMLDSLIANLEFECNSGLYNQKAVSKMQKEIVRIFEIKEALQLDLARFTEWEAKYPYATKVWYFLRENGYSEEVSAGIIGNMMIETSGGSLLLNPTIYDPPGKYYGLCQWSIRYNPDIAGKSFEEQLDYLQATIEREFKTFGKRYRSGFNYEKFLKLETPEEAAYAFAVVYERCSPKGYNRRQRAAVAAYKYFTSEVN
jgi:hypothetical protein